MKTPSVFLFIMFVFVALFSVQAQKTPGSSLKSQLIKVYGECGMCKRNIEKSALQAGAAYADWNEDTKVLNVSYSINKTSSIKIQQAIASSGYDTQEFTATNEAYNNLKECCHYQRKAVAQVNTSCCDNKIAMKDGKTCANMSSENAMACCKDGKCDSNMKCCKDGKCEGKMDCCKDMTTCKEKGCCKS